MMLRCSWKACRSVLLFDLAEGQENSRQGHLNMLCAKVARKIAASHPLCDVLGEEILDESINHPPDSHEYLEEYVRKGAITIFHPTSTARMVCNVPHDRRGV